MLVAPPVSFEAISQDGINACLVAWEHKMGPLNRPDYGRGRFHGLRHDGRLLAVTGADQLIPAETCGLRRSEAIELTRLCAARPSLCRVALRLWREFVFPDLSAAWDCPWAISYQDANLHSGNTYRLDGWVRIGATRSGTDKRAAGGTRKGRNKVVWGWHPDAQLRADRKAA